MLFFRKILIFVLFLTISSFSAFAHSVTLSVYTEGDNIMGEAFFSNGSPVAGAEVLVSSPDGGALGTAKTNSDGEFAFTPEKAVEHVFFIKTSDGHAAKVKLSAQNLPRKLKANKAEGDAGRAGLLQKELKAPVNNKKAANGQLSGITREELTELVDYIVERHTNTLHRKLDQYERERRMGDILGGIGYIFGIFGFYILLRRRKN